MSDSDSKGAISVQGVQAAVAVILDVAERVAKWIGMLFDSLAEREGAWVQSTLSELRGKFPGKNIAIFHDNGTWRRFIGAYHYRHEFTTTPGFSKGYHIYIFDYGHMWRAGAAGWRNWGINGWFLRQDTLAFFVPQGYNAEHERNIYFQKERELGVNTYAFWLWYDNQYRSKKDSSEESDVETAGDYSVVEDALNKAKSGEAQVVYVSKEGMSCSSDTGPDGEDIFEELSVKDVEQKIADAIAKNKAAE